MAPAAMAIMVNFVRKNVRKIATPYHVINLLESVHLMDVRKAFMVTNVILCVLMTVCKDATE